LQSLELLARLRAAIPLRLILLEGLNTAEETIDQTMLWLNSHDIALEEINLLPYHRFGQDKAARLGRPVHEFTTPPPATLERIERQIRAYDGNLAVTIGG